MLEGLEITIFNSKDILKDNEEFRLDSEYYRKEYLNIYDKIDKGSMLVNITKMSDLSSNGSFAAVKKIMNLGGERNIPFIRSGNCGETFINLDDLEYISEKSHINLPKSRTKLYDIMMARKGKIGGASIITEKEVDYNCSENVIKLTISDKSLFNPFYFTVYFNSKFGLKQIERLSTGNVQPWVSIFQIRKLLIPELKLPFQLKTEELVKQSFDNLNTSKQAYNQAENILLNEIGLKDFAPSKEPVNIKSLKDSFTKSGRLDAEYYQVKYDEIERKITSNEFSSLGSKIKRIHTGEYSKEYFKKNEIDNLTFYIRSTNIKGGQIEIDDNYYVPKKEFTRIAKKGDIVTARVGSVGVFGEIRKELEGSIYSDNVLNFKLPDDFIPSVYTLLFNSKFYFELIDRLARGSVQQRLNQETLKDLIIPIIDFDKQQKIANLIEVSFSLKKQSEHLLEVAKKAVEVAIEENEDAAIEYINNQSNSNG